MGFQLSPEEEKTEKKKEQDVGFFESALAGVATGLWNIPKGFVSLGAEIFDLVADTNTAKDVEEWFDNVNPFDDEAEARTIGKITTALTSIGPLAIKGAQVGTRAALLARRALQAKESGRYLSLAKVGSKIMGPTTGAIVGSGVGEAIVADEDIGTFADIAKGTSLEPFAITMMDRETKEGRSEAFRRLKNRLKFGTEGALFNLALVGAGKGIQQLRKPSETGLLEYADSPLKRKLQKYGLFGLKPEGTGTKYTFEARRFGLDNIRATEFAASKSVQELDTAIKELGDVVKNNYYTAPKGLKETVGSQEKFLTDLYDVLRPVDKGSESLLTATRREGGRDIIAKQIDDVVAYKNINDGIKELTEQTIKLGDDRTKNLITEQQFRDRSISLSKQSNQLNKQLDDILKRRPNIEQLVKKTEKGFFKRKNYSNTKEFNSILEKVRKAGGNTEKLENAIINFRMSVDNMSVRLLQRRMPGDVADEIKDNLGKYLNAQYKQFEMSGPLQKYKPTSEQINNATELLKANKIKGYQQLNKTAPTKQIIEKFNDEATQEVQQFLKTKSVDEVDLLNLKNETADVLNKTSKAEVDSVVIKDSVLKSKVLEPWQEELAGLIKDPSYSFYSTVSKQGHLNYTLKYLDDIGRAGSQGPNKFIFSADELSAAQKANPLQFKLVQPGSSRVSSGLEGKYIRTPFYDSVFDTTSNWLNRSGVGTFYKYAVLAPKAASQIAKTILSPLTHVRNFISAGAFVSANGAAFPNYGDISVLLPKSLGGQGVFKQSYDLTGKRILGTMTKADDALYERLLKVGVVDSQVQVGESKRLLKDILKNPSAADSRVYTDLSNNLKNKLLKFYGKTQDAYVAEDDFWKIINWNLERNRYSKLADNLGVTKDNYKQILAEESTKGKYFRKLVQRDEYAAESFDNFLDEIAGNLTRNRVPNYGYVGRTAKALRQSPFGNFIAFPLEILRTGNNIMAGSIDDITAGIGKGTIANPEIPELVNMGLKRLTSFGITVGGVPYALAETFKAKNDVSDEEMNALRRIVPEWSKNSTLLPTGRDENGYLKYIDFSYSNAYDTLIRPFNSVINSFAQGETTKDSLMKSLGTGMADSLYEILEPFASESIYTEALLDSTVRRGIGRGGRRVWSEEDDFGVRAFKGVTHVANSLMPGSISQFKRLERATRGLADKKYGQTFELQDEIPGLFGFRSIQSSPERSLKYMTTRFGSKLKKDDNLFIAPLLRGGRVSPQDIVNAYKYSEARRFATLKEMYQDIEAARTLGMSNSKIRREMLKRKGIKKTIINDLLKGNYSPKEPSDFFEKRIREINRDLNEKEGIEIENPYIVARPFIRKIIVENRKINLLEDNPVFPNFEIPEPQITGQESRITTPQINTPPINANILATGTQNISSTLPANFANLSTADKIKTLQDLGIRIG
jgi:hypothetical protein